MKTILITGAGSGLGKGAAIGLAKAGHAVVAAVEDLAQTEGLEAAKRADKVEFDVIKLNILDQADIEAAHRTYGDRIDILVNNAAIGQTGPIAEIPIDLVRKVFDVNVFGTIALAQAFAKSFAKKRRGKIFFVSSIVGFSTFPFLAPYIASKHALEAVAQIMREEMQPLGVQIATINPGPYRTGFNDRMIETMNKWYVPGRNFTPEKPIQEIRDLFSGRDLQLNPQEMIDFMVKLIPQEHHKFRNVFPEIFVTEGKKYQESLWTAEV